MKLITVEYTQDVESYAGRADEEHRHRTVTAGTVLKVDPMSAKSLVEVRKVARYVNGADAEPTDDEGDEQPSG